MLRDFIHEQMTATELDVNQFNDTPVIRLALRGSTQSRKLTENVEKKSRKRTKSTEEVSTRGRKRKYNTDEERLEARRIQQRQYRERKKAELAALKANQAE